MTSTLLSNGLKMEQTCGIGGWRYNGALPDHHRSNMISISSGSHIALWEVTPEEPSSSSSSSSVVSARRLDMFEAHQDLVTAIYRSPPLHPAYISTSTSSSSSSSSPFFVNGTTSYGGEVALWTSSWSRKLCSVKIRIAKLVHLSFSRDGAHLAATSLYHGGLITVLKINRGEGEGGVEEKEKEGVDKRKKKRWSLKIVKEIVGPFFCAEWTSEGTVFAYKSKGEAPSSASVEVRVAKWWRDSTYELSLLCVSTGEELKNAHVDKRLAEVAVRNEDEDKSPEWKDTIALSHFGNLPSFLPSFLPSLFPLFFLSFVPLPLLLSCSHSLLFQVELLMFEG
jgi:hypothetical protein